VLAALFLIAIVVGVQKGTKLYWWIKGGRAL
jgi:hypothetical protein